LLAARFSGGASGKPISLWLGVAKISTSVSGTAGWAVFFATAGRCFAGGAA
jgi:hypothetical protein